MNEFRARLYDGIQARAREARLTFDEGGRSVLLQAEGLKSRTVLWTDLRIEPPLGRTARRVWLDAISHVEIEDCVDFRRMEKLVLPQSWMRMVSAMESHRAAILGAMVILILVVLFTIKFALPEMARSVAFKLPQSTLDSIGEQSLKTLDHLLLDPSKLPIDRQREIREMFAAVARRVPDLPAYRIEFRSFDSGPNAFALPSGVIIMTDEMVEFARSNEELFAVMGHELGHVRHRHGMRLVLQQTGLLLAVSFFLGDISGSLSSFGALPIVLVKNGYSRQFEQEADDFGIVFCLKAGLGTRPMSELFARLAKKHPEELPAWFSSHPNLEERGRRAEELGKKRPLEP